MTSVLIYRTPTSTAVPKQVPLTQALSDIKGWTSSGPMPLNPRIVKSLELDDYANQNYFNAHDSVYLYIGYYLTTKKVGAAHDPLVCFPGQGWLVSDRQKGKFVLSSSPEYSISYSAMSVQRGAKKELIIYWFQSYDQTNPDTLSQKITSLWKKLLNQGQDNAFVRVSTPIGDKSLFECQDTLLEFIRSFYPVFLNYVKEGDTHSPPASLEAQE